MTSTERLAPFPLKVSPSLYILSRVKPLVPLSLLLRACGELKGTGRERESERENEREREGERGRERGRGRQTDRERERDRERETGVP